MCVHKNKFYNFITIGTLSKCTKIPRR